MAPIGFIWHFSALRINVAGMKNFFRVALSLGALAGLVHWQPQTYGLADIGATVLQLDIRSAMRLGLVEIVFAFLFVDLFDNVGTLVAVGQKAGLFDRAHQIPRINRILLADATATIAGSLAAS